MRVFRNSRLEALPAVSKRDRLAFVRRPTLVLVPHTSVRPGSKRISRSMLGVQERPFDVPSYL